MTRDIGGGMKISTSVYAADERCVMAQLTPLLPHIESLHFDVMDGHFVPGCYPYTQPVARHIPADIRHLPSPL